MCVCVCVCVHFQPLISKLQPCIHSMNTPLLPFPSLSASQLNEVNKLKRLLPSLTPSLLFLLSPSSQPPPCFHSPTSLLLPLSSQLKHFLPLFLTSIFFLFFLIVIVARRKLWDFLPLFPRTELQLLLRREEDQLCSGGGGGRGDSGRGDKS